LASNLGASSEDFRGFLAVIEMKLIYNFNFMELLGGVDSEPIATTNQAYFEVQTKHRIVLYSKYACGAC
jgi:hypothetical protein